MDRFKMVKRWLIFNNFVVSYLKSDNILIHININSFKNLYNTTIFEICI